MKKTLTIEEARKLQGFHQYNNGDYEYQDKNGIEYLMRDGKELCSGECVFSFSNLDYSYEDKDGTYNLFNKDGKKI